MIDDWISSEHTGLEERNYYRQVFANGDHLPLRIPNVLRSDKVDILNDFFEHDAIWAESDLALRGKGFVSRQEWEEASESERLSAIKSLDSEQIENFGPSRDIFFEFINAIKFDRSIYDWFVDVSGLPLVPVPSISAKAMGANDFLGPHNDRTENRRLAYIFYFSRDWQAKFGGSLEFRSGEKTSSLACEHNSLVIFDVLADQIHWISPVHEIAKSRLRYTVGGWFDA
ncbi:2OG-Fe(II) oxygenase family protein [Yoonia sp. BS5-3]|uniref:2OG-Fe(II) oxygenase family protein n=1 Tax=Yoonia phaeophyticola TaxID=3137369 RepID=A0ABZ2V033_9RHOB